MKKEKILNERIFEKLEGMFDKVIYERKHAYKSNPKPGVNDIDHIIRHYASKCARISIGATLMPGQWAVISAVPEIVLGMKKQAEMIYDVAAAYKKDEIMTPGMLAGVLLYSLSGESFGLLQNVNGKYVVNENSNQFDYALAKTAKKIARMLFRSALVRWLPGFPTVSQALISGRVTRNIGKNAGTVLAGEIEVIKSDVPHENEFDWLVNNGSHEEKGNNIYSNN